MRKRAVPSSSTYRLCSNSRDNDGRAQTAIVVLAPGLLPLPGVTFVQPAAQRLALTYLGCVIAAVPVMTSMKGVAQPKDHKDSHTMNRPTTLNHLLTAAPMLAPASVHLPATPAPAEPFVPPQLTDHGTIAGLTQQFGASCEDLESEDCLDF